MSDTNATPGGFARDPAAALTVTGSGGCCGTPATSVALPDPGDTAASPCCGTPADARAAGSCCGATAKAEAVASGAGCCG
ncbi:hypothetical protein WEI85_04665 [Actinomycetes bacterium KLBMP 9797]